MRTTPDPCEDGSVMSDDATLKMSESRMAQARAASSVFPAERVRPAWHTPGMERPGDLLGPYQLLEPLGEGGFGTVWRAEQHEPIHREVALKVIKPGMDSREIIARFEAERQALAMMGHPNIAAVLDAGTTQNGRPYFVMELVRGVSITEYCDARKLTIRERLELFIPVCQAVQHAHQKAILHRDLKPANILVTEVDGRPVPKVIDFGIAKALGDAKEQVLHSSLIHTMAGMVIGTPQYMSPEQAGSVPDVDTRSDIYTLGVILYELLTGRTPVTREDLKNAAVDEMLRLIREEEPKRPSSRFVPVTAQAQNTARQRNSEPGRISHALRGDLDWIVIKALEKDRARRYETADALALDLRHHLQDEPVSAGPPGARYRLHKLMRRHRVVFTAGLVTTLSLVFGLVVSVWQAWRAHDAGELARGRLVEVQEAQKRTAQALTQSENSHRQSEAAFHFIIDALRSADPNADGREARVVDVLDRARKKLEGGDQGLDSVKAAMYSTLSSTYQGLGVFDVAIECAQKAVTLSQSTHGAEHDTTLVLQTMHAFAHQEAGQPTAAVPIMEKVLEVMRRKFGQEHIMTLNAMNNLASILRDAGRVQEAAKLFHECYERKKINPGPEDPLTLKTMINLAGVYGLTGREDEAVTLLEKAVAIARKHLGPEHEVTHIAINQLALARTESDPGASLAGFEERLRLSRATHGEDHADTLLAMINLAGALKEAGRLAEAVTLGEKALVLGRGRHGSDHPETLMMMAQLADVYLAAGRGADAITLREEQVKRAQVVFAPHHSDTLLARNGLAGAYAAAGRAEDAVALYQEIFELRKSRLGPDHPDTLFSMHNLAYGLDQAGKNADAMRLYEDCLARKRTVLGPDHAETLTTQSNFGRGCQEAGLLDKAVPLLKEVWQRRKKTLGAAHPATRSSMQHLAAALQQTGSAKEALPLLREMLENATAAHGVAHAATDEARKRLAAACYTCGLHDEAAPLLELALEGNQSRLGADHPDSIAILYNLANVRSRQDGRFNEAVKLFDEALVLCRKNFGEDHEQTLRTLDAFSHACSRAGRWSEALPHLEESLRLKKARLGTQASATLHNARRLAEALRETGRIAEAETLYGDTLTQVADTLGPDHAEVAENAEGLGWTLVNQRKFDDAEPWLQQALRIRTTSQPGSYQQCNAEALLGMALLGQKNTTEAERLLSSACDGFFHRWMAQTPSQLRLVRDTFESLTRLHREAGAGETATLWQKRWQVYLEKAPNSSPEVKATLSVP